MFPPELTNAIQYNCDISDARDSGIYSICMLVLKLRNLYKWEKSIPPWKEPEPAILLDWIAAKEEFWETIENLEFKNLPFNGSNFDPFAVEEINQALSGTKCVYGAGYGRAMKPVFFLAEMKEERRMENRRVIILDQEIVRELSSPFAMTQENTIYLRKDPLRFFFWDQFQEARETGKKAFLQALDAYDVPRTDGKADLKVLAARLDVIVDYEMEAIIHHELGELLDHTIARESFRKVVSLFPDTSIEYVLRAVKDALADTHENGMLGHIISRRKTSSLSFYVGLLGNLRQLLLPEIQPAYEKFLQTGDWGDMEAARIKGRKDNIIRAQLFDEACADTCDPQNEAVKIFITERILCPLGIDPPQ